MSRTATQRREGTVNSTVLAWQKRGRCEQCREKVAGTRRVRVCVCGGRVQYR